MSELDIKESDLDLGGGVYFRYFSKDGERVGAFFIHPAKTGGDSRHCWGSVNFQNHPDSPRWDFNGDYEKPTLSPSIHCISCGAHGFVRNGKWESC